jgi:hypothetical protein
MQFHATSGCLIGVRRFSTQYVYVWIIQFTAFLLTLRRKNLAPHGPLIRVYGIMLAAGFGVATYDHYTHGCWLLINAMANSAAIMRMHFRVNKYALWTFWAAVLYAFRERLVLQEGDPVYAHAAWWLVSVGGIIAVGAKKIRSYKQITIAAKVEKKDDPEPKALKKDEQPAKVRDDESTVASSVSADSPRNRSMSKTLDAPPQAVSS